MRLEGGGVCPFKSPRLYSPRPFLFRSEQMEEDAGVGGRYAACTWSGTCNNRVRRYFDGVFTESFMVDTRMVISPMRCPVLEP